MATQQEFQQLVGLLQQRQQVGAQKPQKPLSGEASKLIAITKTAQTEIEQLKTAFESNYKKSLLGITTGTDRRLVKLVDQVADKIGRLRSGGAINKEEEERFIRQIASFKDIPFGKKDDAIDALNGYLREAQEVATSIRPEAGVQPLQLTPELQDYIKQKRAGKPSPVIQPVTPEEPDLREISGAAVTPDEITPGKTPLQRVTDIMTSVFPGRKIGEAIGTGIAKLRAAPEERQFISPGPKPKAILGELGEIGLTVAGGGLLGKLGLKSVGIARRGAGKLAQTLEEANLRLSPTQKVNLSNKLKTITDYTSKLTGGPKQRLSKVRTEIDLDESKFQKFINIEAKGKTVNKRSLIDDFNQLKTKYADDRDILDIERQIDNAIKVINRMPVKIPVFKLNKFKRTTFKNAYSRAGDKVSDAIEFDIADATKSSIEKAVKGLKIDGSDIANFNRNYGTKINAAKLLKTATGRAEIGFTGKIVGAIAGASFGTAVGGPAGAAAGAILGPTIGRKIAGTAVRGAIGRTLRKIGPKVIPEIPIP